MAEVSDWTIQHKKKGKPKSESDSSKSESENVSQKTEPVSQQKEKTPTDLLQQLVVLKPNLYCYFCNQVHENEKEYNQCSVHTCKFCTLPLSKDHIQTQCIASICEWKDCGKRGHSIEDCRLAPLCKFCKKHGHVFDECPRKETAVCGKCKKIGHTYPACPRHICEYCKENEYRDFKHLCIRKYDDGYDIKCHIMSTDIKNGTYVCPRCGKANCDMICRD